MCAVNVSGRVRCHGQHLVRKLLRTVAPCPHTEYGRCLHFHKNTNRSFF